MSNYKPFDIRQNLYRETLSQLAAAAGTTVDVILQSINTQETPPLNVLADSPNDLTVTVGNSLIINSESNIQRTFSFINNIIPFIASGTVTFPASSGGDVTSSTGSTATLTITSGQYAQVLLWLDNTGNIGLTAGSSFSAGSLALAVADTAQIPLPTANTLPFAYITAFNNAGTISNIGQSNIVQLIGGGGSSGSSVTPARSAAEVSVGSGATSITITLSNPQSSNSYVVLAQFVNYTDGDPQFQPITISARTTNTFTASWNAPTQTSNYLIDYVVNSAISQIGEYPLSMGATSITISLPTPLATTDYVVMCDFTNVTDSNPMFQPIVISNKTATTFKATWNVGVLTNNYLFSWQLSSYQP